MSIGFPSFIQFLCMQQRVMKQLLLLIVLFNLQKRKVYAFWQL